MRNPVYFGLVLLAAWLSSTMAQSSGAFAALATLPTCALNCLLEAVSASACPPMNTTCVCTNKSLQTAAAVCVTVNCTIKETLYTKNITESMCNLETFDESKEATDIVIAFAVVAIVPVILRMGFRVYAKQGLGPDDILITFTALSVIPWLVLNLYGTIGNGLGRDIWTLEPENITQYLFWFFVLEILYIVQVSLLKLSMLFFFLRIFPSTNVRRLIYGIIAIVASLGVIFVVVGINQCAPVSYFLNQWDGEHSGHCLDILWCGWAHAGINIILDFCMMGLPVWQIRKLNLKLKKKIEISSMFLVGGFVTVVSILRLQSLIPAQGGAGSVNVTRNNLGITNWSTVETCVGIFMACMPSISQILKRVFPALDTSTKGLSPNSTPYSSKSLKNKMQKIPSDQNLDSGIVGYRNMGSKSDNDSMTGASGYGEYTDKSTLVSMQRLHTHGKTRKMSTDVSF